MAVLLVTFANDKYEKVTRPLVYGDWAGQEASDLAKFVRPQMPWNTTLCAFTADGASVTGTRKTLYNSRTLKYFAITKSLLTLSVWLLPKLLFGRRLIGVKSVWLGASPKMTWMQWRGSCQGHSSEAESSNGSPCCSHQPRARCLPHRHELEDSEKLLSLSPSLKQMAVTLQEFRRDLRVGAIGSLEKQLKLRLTQIVEATIKPETDASMLAADHLDVLQEVLQLFSQSTRETHGLSVDLKVWASRMSKVMAEQRLIACAALTEVPWAEVTELLDGLNLQEKSTIFEIPCSSSQQSRCRASVTRRGHSSPPVTSMEVTGSVFALVLLSGTAKLISLESSFGLAPSFGPGVGRGPGPRPIQAVVQG